MDFNASLNWNNPLNSEQQKNVATRSGMDPMTAIGVGSAAVGLFSGIFGNKKTEQGMTLPGFMGYEYIDQMSKNLEQINADMEKLSKLETYVNAKYDMMDKAISGQILPQDMQKQLMDMNMGLATSLGMSAQELAANGFMTEDDVNDLNRLKELESENLTDPRLENQLKEQKAQLMADMQRSGASPQEITQALGRFERDAEETRFTRANELRQSQGSMIQTRMGLRQGTQAFGQQQVMTSMGANQGMLDNSNNAVNMMSNLTQGRVNTGLAIGAQNSALRADANSQYTTAGQMKFDGGQKQYINQGNNRDGAESGFNQFNKYKEHSKMDEFRNRQSGFTSNLINNRPGGK